MGRRLTAACLIRLMKRRLDWKLAPHRDCKNRCMFCVLRYVDVTGVVQVMGPACQSHCLIFMMGAVSAGVIFTALVSRAADKRRPDAHRAPDPLHVGTRLRFAHAKHVAAIAVEEGGHPVVRDAMDMNRDFFQLLHNGAELVEVVISRVLKIDRNMDVSHTETADARCLVRQCLLVRVQRQVHNMAHAERMNVRMSASCFSVG